MILGDLGLSENFNWISKLNSKSWAPIALAFFRILNAQQFFRLIASVKTRPVLETAWQGFPKEGYKTVDKVMGS